LSYYLILRNVVIRQANALSSNYIINAAPIMAINLFAHNLGLKTGNETTGVAIIHHDAQMLGETGDSFYSFAPQQRRAATFIDENDYVKGSQTLSLQPTASIHLKLSLLIEMKHNPDLKDLEKLLRTGRLAGGRIECVGNVSAYAEFDESVESALPKTGFWLVERQDLMKKHANPLEAMMAAIGKTSRKSKTAEGEEEAPSDSWLVPTVLGYAATSEFEARTGVRMLDDGAFPLHAFAEPLIGLAQYVSLRAYDINLFPLWRTAWVRPDVFVAQCNQ
jgi:CRISPR-associated protein Csy2